MKTKPMWRITWNDPASGKQGQVKFIMALSRAVRLWHKTHPNVAAFTVQYVGERKAGT